MTTITAKAKFVRCSPRKMRLIADLICGRRVIDARDQLKHIAKQSVGPLATLLESVIANAKDQYDVTDEKLNVERVLVNGGPTLKRSRARAFGRAAPIRHRTSHIIITLKTDETLKPRSQDRSRIATMKAPAEPAAVKDEEVPAMHVDTGERSRGGNANERKDHQPRSKGFFKQLFQRKSGM